MTAPRSPGFFTLGRLLASRRQAATSCRVIPAEDATERNAGEANVLGGLTFAFWVLAIDALLSGLPLVVSLPLALLCAFILIQLFTVTVALALEKTLVASGKWTTEVARAWHTRGHVTLLVIISIVIVSTGAGTVALQTIGWIWITLALVNSVAATFEHSS